MQQCNKNVAVKVLNSIFPSELPGIAILNTTDSAAHTHNHEDAWPVENTQPHASLPCNQFQMNDQC